jgi:Uncharacterized protein conserved in bacteria (DUF2147)
MKTTDTPKSARRSFMGPLFLLMFLALMAQKVNAQQEISLLGKWRLEDQSLTVNIASCPSSSDLCATITDEVVPPGEKSGVGSIIVKDIRKDVNGKTWRGKFLDGKNEINAVIASKSNDVVTFKGCAFLVFCETQTYNRIK